MFKIKQYEERYAKEMSNIILENLYQINIKDHGKEITDRVAKQFTEEEIIKNFPQRSKVFVMTDDNDKVVGTAGIDRFWGDETGTKFIILTVFVSMEYHHQGIGKILIKKLEKFAVENGAKEIIIYASIHGCEFYRKLGFDYYDNDNSLNKDKEYTLVKYY